MKSYSVKIISKRVSLIPKSAIVLWLIIAVVVLWSLISLFTPTYQSLEELQDCEIIIEEVKLKDSYNMIGSRMKLELRAKGITYYVWYPPTNYREFEENIKRDLLTGNVRCVQVKILKQQSLRDHLFNNIRIAAVESQENTYYDIDTAKVALKDQRVSLIVLFIIAAMFWICDTVYLLLVYRVLRFDKKAKKTR